MSVFTNAEVDYLRSQSLGRLATVDPKHRPHVVPVSFRYNPETDTIDIGGHGFASRKKWRDAHHNPWVAVVVDDIASLDPWQVRGIEIRGKVEILESGGKTIRAGFDDEMFRVRPGRIVSWGLEGDSFQSNARSIN